MCMSFLHFQYFPKHSDRRMSQAIILKLLTAKFAEALPKKTQKGKRSPPRLDATGLRANFQMTSDNLQMNKPAIFTHLTHLAQPLNSPGQVWRFHSTCKRSDGDGQVSRNGCGGHWLTDDGPASPR